MGNWRQTKEAATGPEPLLWWSSWNGISYKFQGSCEAPCCELCKFLLIMFEPSYSVIADKTLLNLREMYKNKVNIKLI